MLTELEIPENLPFLESLCWQREGIANLTPLEMLRRYERGWHYRGVLAELNPQEAIFVQKLARLYGSWLEINDMFFQNFHQKIMAVLNQLDANFLQECKAYFGGGTFVSLNHGEYRLSKDIYFLCSSGEGYRLLRQQIADRGYNAIFRSCDRIRLTGEIQANQYGVRFPIFVEDTLIKFEIVREGRIQLGEPDYPSWCPVPCLNIIDSFAEKLLANSDRWLDSSVESRDLIDLAVQRLTSPIPQAAIDKAEAAYPVVEPLKKAILNFQEKPDYRDRCFSALRIVEPSVIIDGIDLLTGDFGLEKTVRTWKETRDKL
ncbi:MAG TPA: nucleotidyl transferase AbiEii/AbiGii toxin family protein [Leptolyngbyaceae cyanobacterium]